MNPKCRRAFQGAGAPRFAGQLPLAVRVTLHFDNALRLRHSAGWCIPRNADGFSSASDSVGLVQESLTAVLCHNRRMRIQQIRDRRMIVTAFTSFVSIRVIRGLSFFCPRITRMNANRNPLSGAPHSVQAGLPNSPFRIAQPSGRATWGLITKWGMHPGSPEK